MFITGSLFVKKGEQKPADRGYRAAEQKSRQSQSLQLVFGFYFSPCFSINCGVNILENERKCKCNIDFSRRALIFAWRMSTAHLWIRCWYF
jgi:hypothetical protein